MVGTFMFHTHNIFFLRPVLNVLGHFTSRFAGASRKKYQTPGQLRRTLSSSSPAICALLDRITSKRFLDRERNCCLEKVSERHGFDWICTEVAPHKFVMTLHKTICELQKNC